MDRINNTPKLRFPGFTDEWEQRKLSECAGFRRGSFPQPYGNKEWYDGEGAMPFVQVADVADDMKLVDDTKQKISKLAQPMSVYAGKGSVLVTLQGSIGRVAITQYGAFVDRTVLIFDKYNQDIDKTFWAYIIKEKFIDEARKAPGGTIKTITKEALSDFDLMLPSYDEQKKLGAFLVSIDNLITLHQRKCDEVKSLKKCMLQKMFPKDGEQFPEISFPGFTEAWEQRKLGECCSLITKGTTPSFFSEDAGVTFVKIEAIRGKRIYKHLCSTIDESIHQTELARSILKENDIVFAIAGATVGKCAVITKDLLPANTNQALAILRLKEDVDREFVYNSLNSKQMTKYINESKSVGAQPNLSLAQMNAFEFWCPVTIEEQQRIGCYFSNLDNLITLHQRKYDVLKELKKGLLQQMFV